MARNKEELRALMECEFKEMPQPLDYELFNYTENPLGEYGWSIFTNVPSAFRRFQKKAS